MTTKAGLAKALAAVSEPGIPVLLFGALPCVGGSAYQRLNWHQGPPTRAKVRAHWAEFAKLWRHYVLVAEACRRNGGRLALEWPRGCSYWRESKVKSFLARNNMQMYHLDGCMFGLRSQAPKTRGAMLRKPWTIASDCVEFQWLCRVCCHAPSEHVKTQGSDTVLTESYTDDLAHGIHECWQYACSST